MKQKYTIHKDTENQKLVIKEFAELDKEILSLLCEEVYDEADIQSAINEGADNLTATLRTRNMYPPSMFVKKIAAAVVMLYKADGEQSAEILFDDKEFFEKSSLDNDNEETVDTDTEDIDDLLEDEDLENVYEDKKLIKDLKSSIKVADDDPGDPDDDA
jgi:hypothetical protein